MNILRQPFFKREHDANDHDKLTTLEKQIDAEEIALKRTRDNILKYQEEHRELSEKTKNLADDTKFYTGERRKLEVHVDAGGLTLDQIRRKLQEVDPSRFREVMKDLNYMGDEPEWEKRELLDKVSGVDLGGAEGGEAAARL